MSKLPCPPGPRGHWLIGSLPEFRRDKLGFLERCARDYGDFVPFRLGPKRCVLVSHPDLVEQVLVTNQRNFIKHFGLRINRVMLGNGLLMSEGDFWRRQHRLAAPAFAPKRVATYGEPMVACAERMLSNWRDGETRDIHAEMMRLALAIAAETLFGADASGGVGEIGAAVELAMESFARRFSSLFPLAEWLPTPANLKLRWAVGRMNRFVTDIIRKRGREDRDRGDLLSMLLHARDEGDGQGMTDRQLVDEVRTFLLAGHETSAVALSWTWFLLAQHAEVEERLAAELQHVLDGRWPTAADLPRLRYTEMVVKESMRLYPPAYLIGREAVRECELAGRLVPAGTTLFISQWVMHRDPRYFDEPSQFNPERWTGSRADRLPRLAYFPFGGGPRICIGNSFAMAELILVVAAVAQRFRLRLVPTHLVKPWPSLTLRPKTGIRMVLTKREKPARDGHYSSPVGS